MSRDPGLVRIWIRTRTRGGGTTPALPATARVADHRRICPRSCRGISRSWRVCRCRAVIRPAPAMFRSPRQGLRRTPRRGRVRRPRTLARYRSFRRPSPCRPCLRWAIPLPLPLPLHFPLSLPHPRPYPRPYPRRHPRRHPWNPMRPAPRPFPLLPPPHRLPQPSPRVLSSPIASLREVLRAVSPHYCAITQRSGASPGPIGIALAREPARARKNSPSCPRTWNWSRRPPIRRPACCSG